MRSTAGILTLCLVLDVLMASPVHNCKISQVLILAKQEFVNFEQYYVKHTNIKHNNNHHHRPLKIDESEPIDKKMKAAACGLDYMNLSLIAIDEHWKSLHVSVDLHYKLEKLTARLNSTIRSCTSLILKQCPNPPKPDFPKRHFEAKQWIGSFLHSSVKFLEQLIHDQPSWHQHKQ